MKNHFFDLKIDHEIAWFNSKFITARSVRSVLQKILFEKSVLCQCQHILLEVRSSDKMSCHRVVLYFQMCNKHYFHMGYAAKNCLKCSHNIKYMYSRRNLVMPIFVFFFFCKNVIVIAISELRPGSNERYKILHSMVHLDF